MLTDAASEGAGLDQENLTVSDLFCLYLVSVLICDKAGQRRSPFDQHGSRRST